MSNAAQVSPWLVAALCPLFAALAAVYSAVGLGGGTGYLAIMVLVGLPVQSIPATALLLNLGVTGVALVRYGRAGRVKGRVLLPFLVPAIPGALAGGLLPAPPRALLIVLAAALSVAALATFRSARRPEEPAREAPPRTRWAVGLPCGALIGVVSGVAGIGGGVFAGPLLLTLGWADAKQVAGMNALLVFVLSAVGLLGHGLRGTVSPSLVVPFAVATLLGGLVGVGLAERLLRPATLKRIFGVVILVATLKAVVDAVR